jgi:hypothetical protein
MSELVQHLVVICVLLWLWWKEQEIEKRWVRERKLEEKVWLIDDQVNRIATYLDKEVSQKA